MKKQLEKRFSFKEIENEFINEWDNKNIFKFKNYGKKSPFCILEEGRWKCIGGQGRTPIRNGTAECLRDIRHGCGSPNVWPSSCNSFLYRKKIEPVRSQGKNRFPLQKLKLQQ